MKISCTWALELSTQIVIQSCILVALAEKDQNPMLKKNNQYI